MASNPLAPAFATLPGGRAALPGAAPAGEKVWEGALPLNIPISVEAVRELSAADVAAAPSPRAPSSGQLVSVAALRIQHREIARLLVAGVKLAEIAQIMDVSVTSIKVLLRNPAFNSLLEVLIVERDSRAVDIGARLKGIAALALDKLSEKLESSEVDVLPIGELRQLTRDLVDRSGHSPIQRQVNVHLTPDQIRSMRRDRATILSPGTAAAVGQLEAARPESGGPSVPAEGSTAGEQRSPALGGNGAGTGTPGAVDPGRAPRDSGLSGYPLLDAVLGSDP